VTVRFERPDDRRVIAYLREGDVATEVTGWNPRQSAADLLAALDAVASEGYGECFWPEPTGQYWWMLRLVDQRLEVAVMWTAGGASQWQHVFRAADEVGYLRNLVHAELSQQGLST
jgi:hypothetical protein